MRNYVETLTGAFVLMIAGWFVYFFYNHVNPNFSSGEYAVKAKFEQADGVGVGTAVKIGGVKIGVVVNQELDPQSYKAVLQLAISKKITLPSDSSIKVASEGLIGEKYLSISPGGDDEMLKNGEEIIFTQSSVNLESLISKMIFVSQSNNKQEADKSEPAPASSVPSSASVIDDKPTVQQEQAPVPSTSQTTDHK